MEYKKVLIKRKLLLKIDACKVINVALVFMLQFNIFSFDIKSDKKFLNQNLSPKSEFNFNKINSDESNRSTLTQILKTSVLDLRNAIFTLNFLGVPKLIDKIISLKNKLTSLRATSNKKLLNGNISQIDETLKFSFWEYMRDSKVIFLDDYYKGQIEKNAGWMLKEDINIYKPKDVSFEELFTELPQAIDEVHNYFGKHRTSPIRKWFVFGGMMNLCIGATIKAILTNDGTAPNIPSTHIVILPLFAINKDHGFLQGFNDYTSNDVVIRELIRNSRYGLLSTEEGEFIYPDMGDVAPKDPETYISIPYPKEDCVVIRKDGVEMRIFNPCGIRRTILDFYTNEKSMYKFKGLEYDNQSVLEHETIDAFSPNARVNIGIYS